VHFFGAKFVADGAILGVFGACMELLAATTTKIRLYLFSAALKWRATPKR
jgi:hypothetical protein